MDIKLRKIEHIDVVLNRDVQSKESTLLEYVRLVHNAMPEQDFSGVDLSKEFCGFTLGAPIAITGMTGGHEASIEINKAIAKVSEAFNIAFGVGSQRAGIENPSLINTYKVARDYAPNSFIIANVGAAQLNKGFGIKEAEKAIDMVKANALAIHLNAAQEVYQQEGDKDFSRLIEKVEEIVEGIDVPVIIKEVGNGLNMELVSSLSSIGVRCFDVAGLGGTSWVKVEGFRSKWGNKPGKMADYWGNPTAVSIVEARYSSPYSYIIGSGGIRDGLDAAKAISLGADIAGFAFPALKALEDGGVEGLKAYVSGLLYQLKTAIFLVGGRDVYSLWRSPITIFGRLREELTLRGISVDEYLNRRLYTLLWRRKWYGV